MKHAVVPCAAAVALLMTALSQRAEAAPGSLPLPSTSFGVGYYLPTSSGSNVEGVAPPTGVSVTRGGGVSFELEVQPGFPLGGYQVSAAYLGSLEHVTTQGGMPVISGGLTFTPGTEFVSQTPITIERVSNVLNVVHFGAGLGYDFVHVGGNNAGGVTPPSRSGVVGDAFVQVGTGGGTSLEGKYYFGTHAALGGIAISLVSKI